MLNNCLEAERKRIELKREKTWCFKAVGFEISYTHHYDAYSDERGTVTLDLKLLSDVRFWTKHGNVD